MNVNLCNSIKPSTSSHKNLWLCGDAGLLHALNSDAVYLDGGGDKGVVVIF